MSQPTPVELTRHHGGGVRVVQGRSYIRLSRDEAIQLIHDMYEMIAEPAEKKRHTGAQV